MDFNVKFSIAIPTYEMMGYGALFLEFSFFKLETQTFKEFEVVVSDHSIDDSIKNLCKIWGNRLNINYIRNESKRGSSSSNINNAISNCNGSWIKVLFQDDFLYDEHSIQHIVSHIETYNDCKWLVTACEHSDDGVNMKYRFYPKWNDNILFTNTLSSPSVLTFKNEEVIHFDENLMWYMDCDYYYRLYLKWGIPHILNEVSVVNRIHKNQITNTMITQHILQNETEYLKQKYTII
jgi:hypothetical protein